MKAIQLYPYPRLDSVEWSQLELAVNGRPVDPAQLAHRWDANSTISLSLSATAPTDDLRKYGTPTLTLSAGCSETAESATDSSPFTSGATLSSATAAVTLNGSRLAQQMEIRATLNSPYGQEGWLHRRIIAERPAERIALQSELRGFPTSAQSFLELQWRPAPWSLHINATDLSDPFAHSIRLILNVDYPRVEELIEGRSQPHVGTALNAAILRALMHW